MKRIRTYNGYHYYKGQDDKGIPYYNVVPVDQPEPTGGYYNKHWICSIKKVPNYF